MAALCTTACSVLAMNAAAADRSAAAVRAFRQANPCPATGQARGPCPGWVVDHRMPLCTGGEDHPSNLQWQATEDAKAKDRDERRLCRSLKR